MLEIDIFSGGYWLDLVKMMVYLIPILMVGMLAFSMIRTRRQEGTAKMFHCPAIVCDKIAKRTNSANMEHYWVVFEMDNGKRKKLLVTAGLFRNCKSKRQRQPELSGETDAVL